MHHPFLILLIIIEFVLHITFLCSLHKKTHFNLFYFNLIKKILLLFIMANDLQNDWKYNMKDTNENLS
jgi:energy-coupling factor transporter transmembrane protein EcfT